VGWLSSSSLPGEGSNVVLAGHHNIRGEVFRYLVDITPDAEVNLTAGDIAYRYVVRERFIIPEEHVSAEQREQNALWVAPTIDERLTMVTCWPYRDNTHDSSWSPLPRRSARRPDRAVLLHLSAVSTGLHP